MTGQHSHHPRNAATSATVTAVEQAGSDIRIIRISRPQGISWLAGQYIEVAFGGLPPRPYSIASAPDALFIEIHIKRGPGQASNYAIDTLRAGEAVALGHPQGSSTLTAASGTPVIAIAGGMGIAPLKAMADHALAAGQSQPFTLLWAANSPAERYLEQHFRTLAAAHAAFIYVPLDGFTLAAEIERRFAGSSLAGCRIYMAGPPAMIAALLPVLRSKGAQDRDISYDTPPPRPEPPP